MCNADDMYRLLLEREQAFQDKTQEVFAHTQFLCEAILQHLEVAPKEAKWISIDMIGQDIIVMVSVPDYISKDFIDPGFEPAKVLTIVIPCSVVDIGDSEVIHQFLDETFDIRQTDDEESDEDVHGIIATQAASRRIVH